MTVYRFRVREVTQGGSIDYYAIEDQPISGHSIKLQNPPASAGSYPDIAQHLSRDHGLTATLTYDVNQGDRYDQHALTWTFVRGQDEITIIDVPRTIVRFNAGP